ncbi:MAG: cell division protein FtsL, partial [Xanthomonadales bacterium]|nr:cell division protein FtsL [Xanthomonadales bacterium]
MLRPAVLICAVLAVAVVGSAIAVVVARHESRRSFAELGRLVVERDELNIEWGRLQLEQATWADPNRIEQMALQQLGLVFLQMALQQLGLVF